MKKSGSVELSSSTYEQNQITTVANYKPIIANRYLLASNFQEIFVADTNPTADDTTIDNLIYNYITQNPQAFEGGCNRNDSKCYTNNSRTTISCGPGGSATCNSELKTRMIATLNPSTSPIRKGFMTQACEDILAIDKSVTNSLSKAGLTTSSPTSVENIKKLTSFVFSDRLDDQSAIDELHKVGLFAFGSGYSTLDQWRFVLLPICMSPMMDSI